MPRSKLELHQAEDAFLSHDEHTAIGDSSPHHARGHSLHSSTDHTDVVASASPTQDQIFYYDETAGEWKLSKVDLLSEGKARYTMACAYQGGSDGVWLQFFRDVPSNEVGFTVPEAAKIRSVTTAAKEYKDNDDVEFEVYKNGTYAFSFTMTYPNLYGVDNTLNYSLAEGDLLSVYVPSKGGSQGEVEYPIFNFFVQVI